MDSTQHNRIACLPASQPWPRFCSISRIPDVAFAFQNLNGQSYFTRASISPSSALQDGSLTYHIQAIQNSLFIMGDHERRIVKAFTKVIAGTANIHQCMLPHPKATCSCYKVHLSDFEYHWLLTEMFHDPDSVEIQTMSARNFGWNSGIIVSGQRVITLRRVLDKTKVARVLVVMLIASPVFGVVVGHFASSAEAGLAVSAGIFALASFIQGLVAWILG